MGETRIQIEESNDKIILKNPIQKKRPLINVIKEIIAVLFWMYVLIKLFVFDIDSFLINKILPEFAWLLNYKFFFLIGAITLFWLFTKSKHIISWTLYVAFYPAVVFLWKIPFLVLKQRSWILAISLINSLISFFKSIKYNFITFSLFMISVALIFGFSNRIILWIAIIILFGLILATYVYRFISVFKPSREFLAYKKILSKIKDKGTSLFSLDETIKNISVQSLDHKQIEKWTTNLQMSVLFNRICLFIARKLKDYQNSRLNFAYYVLTVLVLLVFTVFTFAVLNYALFKINATFFDYPAPPSFFTFFYYSFNNLLFNYIREIVPDQIISQAVYMLECLFAVFLVAIFISLLFSVRSIKYADELNVVIKGIEKQGKEMESFIKKEYKINNIDDAVVELEKMKAAFIKFIYKITESIQE